MYIYSFSKVIQQGAPKKCFTRARKTVATALMMNNIILYRHKYKTNLYLY